MDERIELTVPVSYLAIIYEGLGLVPAMRSREILNWLDQIAADYRARQLAVANPVASDGETAPV